MTTANEKQTLISRQQLPIGMPAYMSTNYHAKAQTIECCNIGKLPKDN